MDLKNPKTLAILLVVVVVGVIAAQYVTNYIAEAKAKSTADSYRG